MAGPDVNILRLLRRVVEIAMPDLRHYYRMTRKGRIVTTYASDGSYVADVQPLYNDERDDLREPVIPRVEIPILWGGPCRGVVCPPLVGTLCDISYYDGDPNYPRISNIRWHGQGAPSAAVGEFVIQLENGVEIRIDKDKRIVALTSSDWVVQCDGDAKITCGGDALVQSDGNITAEASASIILKAPSIVQQGNVTGSGADGAKGTVSENADRTITGSLTLEGPFVVTGNLTVNGSSSVSGTSYAANRSGGTI